MKLHLGLSVIALLISPVLAGTASQAKRLTQTYDRAFDRWVSVVKAAEGNAARQKAWAARPNSVKTGKALWQTIRGNLAESWTLDYVAWLISTTPEVMIEGRTIDKVPATIVRKAVEKHHIKSPRVGPYCVAVTTLPDPFTEKLLQKIERLNPDKRVKGAAALGQAILLRKLGDAPALIKKRSALLQKVIKSQDEDLAIGRTSVLQVAGDEIFRMTKLSLGATAPDIRGIDIKGDVFKLSEYQGKVVMLVFWNTWMPESEKSLKFLRKLHTELDPEKAVVIGVNQDHPLILRNMTKEDETPWRNFSDSEQEIAVEYRISRWPKVFVLDQTRKIRHIGLPDSFSSIAVDALLKK